jgi:TRAP-type mannitol/chloroaromatic compound transport system permease small subunit
VDSFLKFADRLSTGCAKAFSWLIIVLTVAIFYEVIVRYVFNAPTIWAWDVSYMLYGAHFMMGIAYTLHRKGDVRIDVFYKNFSPRAQALIDVCLYPVFFFPALIVLFWAGLSQAAYSWSIAEKTGVTMWRAPIYPFKTILPLATFLLLLQGVAEFLRAIQAVRGRK